MDAVFKDTLRFSAAQDVRGRWAYADGLKKYTHPILGEYEMVYKPSLIAAEKMGMENIKEGGYIVANNMRRLKEITRERLIRGT